MTINLLFSLKMVPVVRGVLIYNCLHLYILNFNPFAKSPVLYKVMITIFVNPTMNVILVEVEEVAF